MDQDSVGCVVIDWAEFWKPRYDEQSPDHVRLRNAVVQLAEQLNAEGDLAQCDVVPIARGGLARTRDTYNGSRFWYPITPCCELVLVVYSDVELDDRPDVRFVVYVVLHSCFTGEHLIAGVASELRLGSDEPGAGS